MGDDSNGRRIGWWPAAVALAIIVAIYFFARKKDPAPIVAAASPTSEPTSAQTIAATNAPTPNAPTAVASVPSAPATIAAPPDPDDGVEKPGPPSADASFYDPNGPLPDGNTRGRSWQLDEKLSKTRESLKTMDLRAQGLEKEIADAEAAGRKDEANEKKVVLARLRARQAELQRSLDAGVDPTTPIQ